MQGRGRNFPSDKCFMTLSIICKKWPCFDGHTTHACGKIHDKLAFFSPIIRASSGSNCMSFDSVAHRPCVARLWINNRLRLRRSKTISSSSVDRTPALAGGAEEGAGGALAVNGFPVPVDGFFGLLVLLMGGGALLSPALCL